MGLTSRCGAERRPYRLRFSCSGQLPGPRLRPRLGCDGAQDDVERDCGDCDDRVNETRTSRVQGSRKAIPNKDNSWQRAFSVCSCLNTRRQVVFSFEFSRIGIWDPSGIVNAILPPVRTATSLEIILWAANGLHSWISTTAVSAISAR